MNNYIVIDDINYLLPPFVVETLEQANLDKLNGNSIGEQERFKILKLLDHFLSSFVACLDEEGIYFKDEGVRLSCISYNARDLAKEGKYDSAIKRLHELIIFHSNVYKQMMDKDKEGKNR